MSIPYLDQIKPGIQCNCITGHESSLKLPNAI